MSKICTYDEAYDIYDAQEIGWCATCACDPDCPMSRVKKHTKHCPSCGESIKVKKNHKEIKFCPYCGSHLT